MEDQENLSNEELIQQTKQLVKKMKEVMKKSSKAYATIRYSTYNPKEDEQQEDKKFEYSKIRKLDQQQRKLLQEKIKCLVEDCIPILKKIEEEAKNSL